MSHVEPMLKQFDTKYGLKVYVSTHGSCTRLNISIPSSNYFFDKIGLIKRNLILDYQYSHVGSRSAIDDITLNVYLKNDTRIAEIEELVHAHANAHGLRIGKRRMEYRTRENLHYLKYKLNATNTHVETYRLIQSNLTYILTDDPSLQTTEEELLTALTRLDDILSTLES